MTTEDRLAAVEQFQQEATTAIREANENVTMLVGVIGVQGQDIKHVLETQEIHTELLRELNLNIAEMKECQGEHTELLHAHTALLQQILARLPAPDQA